MPFKSWADFYSRNPVGVGYYLRSLADHAPLFDAIVSSDPHAILEVGSGTGIMATFLSWLGFEVCSIDNDKRVLERAAQLTQSLNGHCRYVFADAFHLSGQFPPNSFDVCFSQGFFEHFSDDQIRKLITEQLTVSSAVIFSIPSKYYGAQDFGNERLLLPQDWQAILNQFPSVTVHGYHQKQRSLSSILRKGLTNPSWVIPWHQTEHILVAVQRHQ